jgi:transposase
MAAIPTFEEEDAKRPNRERETLVGGRTRIINRMKGAFARLGIRGFNPKLRKAPERLAALRTPEGQAIPPNTLAELQRDMAHLRFINEQIKLTIPTFASDTRSCALRFTALSSSLNRPTCPPSHGQRV